MGGSWQVFISYARADGEWVRTFAENLHQLDVDVFYDEWTVAPGDVVVHELDEGLRDSLAGVLVVSPVTLERPWVRAEYAAMMTRAVQEAGFRLIPVLLKDAELPPLLASCSWVDFRTGDGPAYFAKVKELAALLKGERPGPPPRTGVLKPPPGTGVRPEGTIRRLLAITRDRATLQSDGVLVQERVRGADPGLESLVWELGRSRKRCWGTARDASGGEEGLAEMEKILAGLGLDLAEAFLPAPVADRLAADVAEAERLGCPLELALQVEDALAGLPWETLRLPERPLPLTLHPRVHLYRRLPSAGAATAIAIPPPLRILVAIGSPDAQNARGELLDMEAEVRRILDAVEKAKGKAHVRILETGSPEAICEALRQQRYHVLYISCHAEPGRLVLETADGVEVRVTASELIERAIPAGRGAPLVVLAACSTASDRPGAADGKAEELPAIARALVAHGVPQVIAMTAPVGDAYATALAGELFEALAGWQQPEVPAALASARQDLEQARLQRPAPRREPPEWATPALFTCAEPLPLFDPKAEPEKIEIRPEPGFDPGVVVRRIGDVVGRRREQRLILRALREANGAGVLLHGIGGVGKSTLAAHILHRLAADDGFLLISLEGETDPDRILSTIGQRLFGIGMQQGWDERHPLRQLSGVLREPKYPWRDRFEFLAQNLLAQVPLAFLFDNFEDNLRDSAPPDELAALLARWLQAPLKSRLVFTCRHPFALPDDAHERLAAFHLGPLSWAETRKLFWRLEGLKALSLEDQRRAYENVGGHPRALEYLDSILRGGTARFDDVTIRLRKQLKAKGIPDPARWCADAGGGLDAALAETVTLAADDVLLDQLLAQLADDPLAHRLLIGASVYRVPVDEPGLIWPVGKPVEHAPDPERTARLQAMQDRLKEARKENPATDWGDVFQSKAEWEQALRDQAEENRPPVAAPRGFPAAKQRLMELSLLAPVRFADDQQDKFLVHRWTAGALARRASKDEQTAAHRVVAAYWRWRAEKLLQPPERQIADLLEARHHLHALGDLAEAYSVSFRIINQLQTWRAWEWEDRLTRETLGWMPEGSKEAAALLHELGIVARFRGDYDAALDWFRQSMAIKEQLGDRAGMAASYRELGRVAQLRGDYDAALEGYRRSLAITEQLGDRAGMAASYHQLGMVAKDRGDYDAALEGCRQSLAIKEQLGDRAGMAASYHQLGMVAQDRGDYDAALEGYRKSLAIDEQLGDRAGMALSYHTFGVLSLQRGDYDGALDWFRKSVATFEQLGDRAGMAASYHQLGIVARFRGDDDAALDWFRQALAIKEQLGDRVGMARSYRLIGSLYTLTGRAADAVPLTLQSLVLHGQMQRSDAQNDLYWLSHQRRTLGAEAFRAVVAEHCDAESTTRNLLALLDDFDRTQAPAADPQAADPAAEAPPSPRNDA